MKNISGVLKGINEKNPSQKKLTAYESSGFLRTVYRSEEDAAKVQLLYKTAQESLANVTFDEKKFTAKLLLITAMAIKNSAMELDEKTCELMKQIAAETNLREGGKKFLEDLGITPQ